MTMKSTIQELKTADFDYVLPEELIAYAPLEQRDASRLMVIENSQYQHSHYSKLPTHLPPGTRLVFNNTKVIAARLFFKTMQEKEIEIFLLEPLSGDYNSLQHKKSATWKCLIGGSKKWKKEETLEHTFTSNDGIFILHATFNGRNEDCFVVTFDWEIDINFYGLIELVGNTPLPPYIKRAATAEDINRYQTVYAKSVGSVAAPTAGLHFTDELMQQLHQNNTATSYLTLHVGAGTFKPVTASSIVDHTMHKEFFEVSLKTLEELAELDRNIIPVGTTSLRTLESLYWIGLKIYHAMQDIGPMNNLDQWEHFDLMQLSQHSYQTIVQHIVVRMKEQGMNTLHGHTGICITPGYPFKVAKGLITNFHQPQSTLLFIIAAFLGDTWKDAYETAVKEKYRFLSYGDGMLIKL
jgi:S-adenosylmethionine:tRNA ribosyltransferase-isomerase